MENVDTEVNSKAKSHVTLRRAVLEEIGNRVTTRATQGAKVTTLRTIWAPAGATLAVPLVTHLSLIESSEHQGTCSAQQNNKCQQTAQTCCFCETGTDEDVGAKGRKF